jgi:hypothetical protein
MTKKRIVRVTGKAALLLVAAYSALSLYAKGRADQTRKNAEVLLGEVRNLRPGKAMLAHVERLARIDHRYLMKEHHYWDTCSRNFDFLCDNGLLFSLRLATRTSFEVF